MLLRCGVALTPGCGFGSEWDTHVRLSFATSEERIRTGLERMASALSA
jgi:aspartate/methionine/tyrosine aminotransferase